MVNVRPPKKPVENRRKIIVPADDTRSHGRTIDHARRSRILPFALSKLLRLSDPDIAMNLQLIRDPDRPECLGERLDAIAGLQNRETPSQPDPAFLVLALASAIS